MISAQNMRVRETHFWLSYALGSDETLPQYLTLVAKLFRDGVRYAGRLRAEGDELRAEAVVLTTSRLRPAALMNPETWRRNGGRGSVREFSTPSTGEDRVDFLDRCLERLGIGGSLQVSFGSADDLYRKCWDDAEASRRRMFVNRGRVRDWGASSRAGRGRRLPPESRLRKQLRARGADAPMHSCSSTQECDLSMDTVDPCEVWRDLHVGLKQVREALVLEEAAPDCVAESCLQASCAVDGWLLPDGESGLEDWFGSPGDMGEAGHMLEQAVM